MKRPPDERLTVDGFKKWMDSHGGLSDQEHFEEPPDKHVGLTIEARVSVRKMASHLEVVSGKPKDLLLDFKSDGGTIMGVEDTRFLVEVISGRFYIPKYCVRRRDIG